MLLESPWSLRGAVRRVIVPLAGLALVGSALAAPVAFAQDAPADGAEAPPEIPQYLLEQLGVRVDLPEKEWEVGNDDWTDYSLKATSKDGVLLFAWTTSYQIEITEDTLADWQSVFLRKARTEGEITQSSVETYRDVKVGSFELALKNSEGGELAMFAYTMPLEGTTLHIATATTADRADIAKRELEGVMERLEIKKMAPELTWGGLVSAPGIDATLDDYFRKPVGPERMLIVNEANNINISSLRNCWSGIHPHPPGKADVVIACVDQRHSFAIVDDLTFADNELELREAWFPADAEPGEQVTFADRTSFWWQPKIGDRVFNTGAVPIEGGLAKVVAVAGTDQVEPVAQATKATLQSATFSVVPEPPFEDVLRYYVVYRPTSPLVIAPIVVAVVLLLLIFGLIIFGLRKQAQIAREEMEALD